MEIVEAVRHSRNRLSCFSRLPRRTNLLSVMFRHCHPGNTCSWCFPRYLMLPLRSRTKVHLVMPADNGKNERETEFRRTASSLMDILRPRKTAFFGYHAQSLSPARLCAHIPSVFQIKGSTDFPPKMEANRTNAGRSVRVPATSALQNRCVVYRIP